jgi:hypothetical protein
MNFNAYFLIGGVPFFIFSSNIIIFLSRTSSGVKSSSFSIKSPKWVTSSGLMKGSSPSYSIMGDDLVTKLSGILKA